MLILTIRTDKPEAEIGLFENDKKLAYETWPAHRQLAETIHTQIDKLLMRKGRTLAQVEGIVCFAGPGSFTGLRIGVTVANTLGYGLEIPIVAARTEKWIDLGIKKLLGGENDQIALPYYGSPVHITQPRK
ncbi:MAG: tRNA (adenosine(37)-N6)-threonylcarbamoyltransferase complex dimerization subunit type 1 TsaB [Candidatus Saccharimonadales bacterium]